MPCIFIAHLTSCTLSTELGVLNKVSLFYLRKITWPTFSSKVPMTTIINFHPLSVLFIRYVGSKIYIFTRKIDLIVTVRLIYIFTREIDLILTIEFEQAQTVWGWTPGLGFELKVSKPNNAKQTTGVQDHRSIAIKMVGYNNEDFWLPFYYG